MSFGDHSCTGQKLYPRWTFKSDHSRKGKKESPRMTFEGFSGAAAAQAKHYAPEGRSKVLWGPQLQW